jgi:hypothetical protein
LHGGTSSMTINQQIVTLSESKGSLEPAEESELG